LRDIFCGLVVPYVTEKRLILFFSVEISFSSQIL
jgi:hypothetical protein